MDLWILYQGEINFKAVLFYFIQHKLLDFLCIMWLFLAFSITGTGVKIRLGIRPFSYFGFHGICLVINVTPRPACIVTSCRVKLSE